MPLHHDYPSDEDEGSLFFQNPFFSASTSDKGQEHSPSLPPSFLPPRTFAPISWGRVLSLGKSGSTWCEVDKRYNNVEEDGNS